MGLVSFRVLGFNSIFYIDQSRKVECVALTYGTFYPTFELMLPSVQLSSSSYQFLALRLAQEAKERGPEEFNEHVVNVMLYLKQMS